MSFDAHTHLDFPDLPDDALEAARAAGVTEFCIAAADPAHWDRVEATAHALHAPYALGIHPWFAAAAVDALDAWLAELDRRAPPLIGEVGLDRHAPGFDDAQPRVARAQLARLAGRPVVLHVVKAHGALLDLLPERCTGMVHRFVGPPATALRYVERGLHVSFGPRAAESPRTVEAFRALPVERLLLESDCPDGAPGPAAIVDLARALAPARGTTPEALLAHTASNARALLRAE